MLLPLEVYLFSHLRLLARWNHDCISLSRSQRSEANRRSPLIVEDTPLIGPIISAFAFPYLNALNFLEQAIAICRLCSGEFSRHDLLSKALEMYCHFVREHVRNAASVCSAAW
jgi:hypothetical protein